jgi:hypothetical protein
VVGTVRSAFALISKHNLAASTSECSSAIVDELPAHCLVVPPFSRTSIFATFADLVLTGAAIQRLT